MAIDLSKVPKLGFGLMRLPENEGKIDYEQVNRMVDAYMDAGMNYFDTAYVYHGGNSEVVVRESIVKRYPRDSFTIATKLPAWCMSKPEDRDRIFSEQLERMGTDHIDFYLLHSLEDGNNYDTYERLDCFNWGLQKKAEGKIKHFGFSFHGTPGLLAEVLDKHPEMEFVQIQLNYLDWNNPVVESGALYDILRERNIPIIVMEPVKGGTLANIAPGLEKKFKDARPGASVASWALRYTASLDGVMTVLSGMSNEEQMTDNINTFRDFEPLTESEKAIVSEVTSIMLDTPLIGCTSCRYCCDGCPSNISIPDVFRVMDTIRVYKEDWRAKNVYGGLVQRSGKASDCIGCGQCEGVCPQHLNIIDLLREAAEILDKGE